MKGLVFDIQRFSIYDGPGIRTTVFLKGCSLDCDWCHNPESISNKKEVQTYFFKCIGCGKCFETCPNGAHKIVDNERVYDRDICQRCGRCTDGCYSGALIMTGDDISSDKIVEEVSRDIPFYNNSKGGVTISGGEPLLQSEFTAEVLEKCKDKNIHTAVDTAGNVPFDAFMDVIPYTDLFLFDLKAIDSDVHKRYTGVGNSKILENLIKLDSHDIPIIIRIPVIPDVNDGMNLQESANYLANLKNVIAVEPLAYHSLGGGKLESLGSEGSQPVFKIPDKDRMIEVYEVFEKAGLSVLKKHKKDSK